MSEEQFHKMQNSYTKITIDGNKLNIDVKGKNGLQIAEPSKYRAVDGSIKKYTWVDDSIYKYEIKQLPPWLFNIILNSANTQIITTPTINLILSSPSITNSTTMENTLEETANSEPEYIYVMYNEMFKLYGDDIYKIGKSKDIAKRMTSYTTSYVKPVEIKFLSGLCIDYHLCEKVIFDRLCNYRISPNREFFNLNIEQMVNHIEEVVSGVNNGTITERPPKLLGNHHEPSRSNISDETKAHQLSIVKDILESWDFNVMTCISQSDYRKKS